MIPLLAAAAFTCWSSFLIWVYLRVGEWRARRAFDRERRAFERDHEVLMDALRKDRRR